MAVLIEAISVVIRRDAVEARFAGGMPLFLKSVPNRTLCHDEHLLRVGFMDTTDSDAYVASLEAAGLILRQGEMTVDFVVVVQVKGPTFTAPWLKFQYIDGEQQKLSLCWAMGSTPEKFSAPAGWTYERSSLSATGGGFMPASAIGDRMRFLRRENGVEVYLDLQTNKELFVGRPQISGDAPQALLTQINAAVHEAFAIERQGPVPQPRVFKPRDPRYKRLNDELLPAMQRITTGPGREIMAAHLAEGIIQRLLNRLPQAEKALRKAHELQPMTIGPLRDLIRCIAEQGRPREALPYARQAASIDQTDAAALGNLAACLMQCGETEEAIIVVARALEIDPDDGINRHVQRALLDRGRTRP